MDIKRRTTDGFATPNRPESLRGSFASKPSPVNKAHPAAPAPDHLQTIRRNRQPLETLDMPNKPADKKPRRFKFKKLSKKALIARIAIVLGILLLCVAGYFGYKLLSTSAKIFGGNPLSAILSAGKDLKMDENGRSNILLFSTSEDDPGHDGPNLTDSIMVLSVDQKKNNAFMVSIPRDMRAGACYTGKINEIYYCARGDDTAKEAAGQDALRAKTGEILGLDVQYAVHVNYTALRQAVAAVGNITVTIESRDPKGQMDSNFDWKCGVSSLRTYRSAKEKQACPPNGHFIDYPNGPATLDAEHALYLAQARGAQAPTYGFEQSNFDREKNQQKIIVALKEKALSAGTLANPVAVSNLLDALGDNVRTNFDADEVKTLVRLGREIDTKNIHSLPLNNEVKSLLGFCGSDICPTAGTFAYAQIHEAVAAFAAGNYASIEMAVIAVLNASGEVGAAQAKADEITKNGLTVAHVSNAPNTLGETPLQLLDQSDGKKPETLKKLEELLGVKATTQIPAGVSANADFTVIVGKTATPAN